MPTEEFPEVIELDITKEDLRDAGPYINPHTCLLATALKRVGFVKPAAGNGGDVFFFTGPSYTSEGIAYAIVEPDPWNPSTVLMDGDRFGNNYRPELLGRHIKLQRVQQV